MALTDEEKERAREIGARIAVARRQRGGMRQQDLAKILGVSLRSVEGYEAGNVIPYPYLDQIADATGRSVRWILHGDDNDAVSVDVVLERLNEIKADLQRVLVVLGA